MTEIKAKKLTKIKKLTYDNLRAIGMFQEQLRFRYEGKTFVVLEGTPEEALARVQLVMADLYAKYGGRATGYRSLVAVRLKLRNAALTQGSEFVEVIEEAKA